MESYLILVCIGVIFIICYYSYLKNVKKSKNIRDIYPLLNRNIEFLKTQRCKYTPDIKIKLHFLRDQKKYNEMISTLKDKVYELNILFNKLRYTIERTKFGEFLTASDIFKSIIEDEDIRQYKKYSDIEKEIKGFKSKKTKVENLMQNLLDKSIKLIENQKQI